jgi:hypothetical protein
MIHRRDGASKGHRILSQQGVLPMKLVETVATNDFERWKSGALKLQKRSELLWPSILR